MPDEDDLIAAKEALRRAQLEAARNLEPDCAYGAVGAGRYRVDNEHRRAIAAPAATPQQPGSDPAAGSQEPDGEAVPCPHPEHRISVPVNGRYTCMQCGHDVPRPRRPRPKAAAQPRELIRHRNGLAADQPQPVRLDDLDYERFRKTMKNPPPPTAALTAVLEPQDCDQGPATPLALAVHAERHDIPLAQAIGRAGTPHIFVIDNRPGKDPTPEPFPDEFLEIGPLSSTRWTRTKAVVEGQLTDYVAPPIRVSFCPACKAEQGVRCEGFERWDECHIERVHAAMMRSHAKPIALTGTAPPAQSSCAECVRKLTPDEAAKPPRSGLGRICDRCAVGRE